MSGFSLTIEVNNIDEVLEGLDEKIERALELIGAQVENYAIAICPTDTGRLKNSITHALDPDGQSVHIGSNVEYAAYVECGHHTPSGKFVEPQPYLEPAVMDHVSEYEDIAREQLSQ